MALHVLAYNLTRVMNIFGVKPLLAAIRREPRVRVDFRHHQIAHPSVSKPADRFRSKEAQAR
jgi:hypothetical protein